MPARRPLGLSQAQLTCLLAAALAAAAVALLFAAGGGSPRLGVTWDVPWVALLAAFILVNLGSAVVPRARQSVEISATELPTLVGLGLFAPVELVAAAVVSIVVTKPWLFRTAPERVLFNAALNALEIACAVLVFRAIVETGAQPGPELWIGGLLAALTSAVVSGLLVNLAIALVVGGVDLRRIPWIEALSLVPAAVSSSFALVALSLAWWDPRALVLLAVPVAAFFVHHRQVQQARTHYERIRGLYETSGRVRAALSVEDAVAALLAGARATFDADVAGLVLPTGEGAEPVRLVDRGEGVQEEREDPQPLLWHTMVAAMGDDGGLVGHVFVGRVEARLRFHDEDRRSFETLIDHAAVTIERGRLQHRAFHDPLTGLPNRAHLARARPAGDLIGVVYLDLDDFKAINDSLGHATGDALLRAVAGRLRGCLRRDDIPARLGGDEFAIVLADLADPEEARAIAERLLEALHQPYRLDGTALQAKASLGLAVAAAGERTLEQLLREADAAMYEAKRTGKGRVALAERQPLSAAASCSMPASSCASDR